MQEIRKDKNTQSKEFGLSFCSCTYSIKVILKSLLWDNLLRLSDCLHEYVRQ